MIYILKGRGSTSVWYDERRKNSFEWQAGSLFSIPLNAWYQHFNGSGAEPARYVAVNTAPIMMNLIRNDEFIFNNNAVFPERYAGEDDYFSRELDVQAYLGFGFPFNVAYSNFFADVNGIPEHFLSRDFRGKGTKGISFILANGVLGAHILEFPGGVFSKLHRHGPGAHVLWLRGEGYSLMWPDGGERVHETWGPGTMIVPPDWWWHMHAVVSQEPAQHLALRLGNTRRQVNRANDGVLRSSKTGGSQMDYEDFPPELMAELMRMFEEACAKRGTRVQLEAVSGM
jgi:uncharacterized RmlC-like cupin family protein